MTYDIDIDEPIAPANLVSYMVLRNAIGEVVGIVSGESTSSADDIEVMLGVYVETKFIQEGDPIFDMICRMKAM